MSEYLNEVRNPVDPDENGNTKWLRIKVGGRSTLSDVVMYAPINLNKRFTYNRDATDGTSIIAPRPFPSNLLPCASVDATYEPIIDITGAVDIYTEECAIANVAPDIQTGEITNTSGGNVTLDIYWSARVKLNEPSSSIASEIEKASLELQNFLHTCTIGVSLNNLAPAGGAFQTKTVENTLRDAGYVKFSGYISGLVVPDTQTIKIVANNILTSRSAVAIPAPADRVKIIVSDVQLTCKTV